MIFPSIRGGLFDNFLKEKNGTMFVKMAVQLIWSIMSEMRTDLVYSILVFLCALGAVRILQWFKYLKSLPPGPWGFPVLGYLPFIKGDLHLQFGGLAKKYGSMFSARLGTKLVVVLSDYRTIRDTFRREEFSGRPHTEFMNILEGYGELVTFLLLSKELRQSTSVMFIHVIILINCRNYQC